MIVDSPLESHKGRAEVVVGGLTIPLCGYEIIKFEVILCAHKIYVRDYADSDAKAHNSVKFRY